MKKIALSTALFLVMLSFGCGSDGLTNRTISGVSQKGPFVMGSTVTVQELQRNSLAQTGSSFMGKINNDQGEFTISSVPLASQYVMLKVDGFYRNEVTGTKSKSSITMTALADISDRDHVNINLFTHLENDRVTHLVASEGMKFAQAKKQAREELLHYFAFTGNFGNTEDMNIFGKDANAAALLAMSIIVQGDLAEAEFTERMARLANDFVDGSVDNQELTNQMAKWALAANLGDIRRNIENWGEQVPDFEPYVRAFWRSKLGLGSCNTVGEKQSYQDVELICTETGWEAVAENTNFECKGDDCVGLIKCSEGALKCEGNHSVKCVDNEWKYMECGPDRVCEPSTGLCVVLGPECTLDSDGDTIPDCYDAKCTEGTWKCVGLSLYKCFEGKFIVLDCPFGCNAAVGSCQNPGCGNGVLDYAEQCDDGNFNDGDGCSNLCQIEYGWICNTPGSPCVQTICGNGKCEEKESPYSCPSDCKAEWECNDENAYPEATHDKDYPLGICNEDNLEEVKEFKKVFMKGYDCRYLYDYFTCKGYGNNYRWQRSTEEEMLDYLGPCGPNAEIKEVYEAQYCYVCKNNQWSSNETDFKDYVLGMCNAGEIKQFEYKTKCFGGYSYDASEYFEYMVCDGNSWRKASSNDIPPGKCSDEGAKRRMDGVCYVCEKSSWTKFDCSKM